MPFARQYGEPAWPFQSSEKNVDELYTWTAAKSVVKMSYEEDRLSYEAQFVILPPHEPSTPHVQVKNDVKAGESTVNCGSSAWVDNKTSYSSSLSERQKLYLSWSQSTPVNVIVGFGSEEHTFHLPRDFLTRRSMPFRAMLDGRFSEATSGIVRLPAVSLETFQHATVWLMSLEPRLDPDLPLPVTVDIAVFATIYDITALLHQALDILRARVIPEREELTPDLLDQVYSCVDEDSLLRHLMRATLPLLSCPWSSPEITDDWLKRWQEAFECNAALGYDFFVTRMRGWTEDHLSEGGRCRFHRHKRRDSKWLAADVDNSCPYVSLECFQEANSLPYEPTEPEEEEEYVDSTDQEKAATSEAPKVT